VFSATHICGRSSRATHARSHPNIRAHRHILVSKPRALPLERGRQEPAPRRLTVVDRPELHKPAEADSPEPHRPPVVDREPHRLAVRCKAEIHRPAVPCTPAALPELRIRRQVPPNQQQVLRRP
jgi:hypothetical protein